MDHKIWFIDKIRSLIRTDFTSNNVVNIVLAYLLLNTKQENIVCKVMRHTMYNQATPRLEQSNQLLFVIRGKSSISKSQIIKAINQVYNVIGKIKQFFIIVLIRTAANNRSESTLYMVITLGINTWKTKASVQRQ